METLIAIALVCGIVGWLVRQLRKSGLTPSSRADSGFQPTLASRSVADIETGQPIQRGDAWVLNPKSPFPLSVVGIDATDVSRLWALLDSPRKGGLRAVQTLMARTNVRCVEIDDWIARFKPVYLEKIEDQKARSAEWGSASTRDRENLLVSFRRIAIAALDVRPDCDVETLLENEPTDASIDDALINRYGLEPLLYWLRHADNIEKVRVVPAEHRDRSILEELVRLGLARQGGSIPIQNVLEILKLNTLNELCGGLVEKPFTRKQAAVEFLSARSGIGERIVGVVAFREIFQLLPLPTDFASVDLRRVEASLKYSAVVADLLVGTYFNGARSAKDLADFRSEELDWEVSSCGDERTCPLCLRMSGKKSAKGKNPLVPLHVGCRCGLLPKL